MNLNATVSVRLTAGGLAALRRDVESIGMPHLIQQPRADGTYRFQLWELMRVFGGSLWMGCEIPFEGNEIQILDEAT